MKELKPLIALEKYSDLIAKKINAFWDDILFNYLDLVNEESVLNDNSLESDILSGRVFYVNGVFIPKKKFNTKLAKKIEDIGGEYKKSKKGYVVDLKQLPLNIQNAIAQARVKDSEKQKKIIDYLTDFVDRKDFISNQLDFTREVTVIEDSLNNQFKQNMKAVSTIPMEMTEYQKEEIARNYTENLNKYIKTWTDTEIVKMRKDIIKMVSKGYNQAEIKKYILSQKEVGKRKAKFLARNETRLLVTEYQKNRYKQEGITQYKWSAVMDNRTRSWHRHLDGKIFSIDNPPIIDERTGERGNAGEAYNCRCKMIPVINEVFWK